MNVSDGATNGLLMSFADPGRPLSRAVVAGVRGMSINSPYLSRMTGTACTDMRPGADGSAVPAGSPSPTGRFAAAELAVPRALLNDCLTSIGLPGEEEATTFVPLVIEPYEPILSIGPEPVMTPIEPPQSPLTPPTAPPHQMSSPSAAAAAAAATAAAGAAAGCVMMPRPPPGSAGPRGGSCRRSLVRQTSHVGTAVAAAAIASAGAAAAANSGGAAAAAPGTAVPTAPRTPVPTAVDSALVSPSPALAIAEVPVVVFDPTAVVAGDSRPTSAFLDPSKPAMKRLLPPLLWASQALQDSGGDVSPSGSSAEDGATPGGCSLGGAAAGLRNGSFTAGGNASPGPDGGGGPSGALGGVPEDWAELPDVAAAGAAAVPPPLLLSVDPYDASSPRGPRRALPPMELSRTSGVSATSTMEAPLVGEGELPFATSTELAAMSSEALGSYVPSPRRSDVSSARRAARELRGWGLGTSDAWESQAIYSASASGGDGDAGYASAAAAVAPAAARGSQVQRTVSFHSAGSGCSINGFAGGVGGQPILEGPRLRARSGVAPEYTLLRLSSGDYCVAAAYVSGGQSPSPSPKESIGRPASRPNSLGLSPSRMVSTAVAATAAATATAALPPIVDRAPGQDSRQTAC